MSEVSFLDGYSNTNPADAQPKSKIGANQAPLLILAATADFTATLLLFFPQLSIHLVAYVIVAFAAIPAVLLSRVQADRRAVEEGILVSRRKQRFSALLLATSLLICIALSATIAWATT